MFLGPMPTETSITGVRQRITQLESKATVNCEYQAQTDRLKCEVKYQGQTETMNCNSCGKHYKTQKGLREHKCTFCQVCKRDLRSVKTFSTHTCTVAHDSNKLPDELYSVFKNDVQAAYNQEIRDMNCTFCGRHFKTEKSLKGHKCSYWSSCKIYGDCRRYKEHKCDILKTNFNIQDKGNHKANINFC